MKINAKFETSLIIFHRLLINLKTPNKEATLF